MINLAKPHFYVPPRKTLRRWALHLASYFAVLTAITACNGGTGSANGESILGGGSAQDPFSIQVAIAYVRRSLPATLPNDNLELPYEFNPGAALFLRDRAATSGQETNITARIFGNAQYDVKDVSVSADGEKLVFAMHAPETDPNNPLFTWNLWEYDLVNDTLTRLITDDILAEEAHDFAPAYLPDGRIVFSSTRQQGNKAILLDEGKPQYQGVEEDRNNNRRINATTLHIWNPADESIEQLSFNQSHDLDPTVLDSGEILFTRWDNFGNRDAFSLYRINPNGTDLTLMYGYHSQNTGFPTAEAHLTEPTVMPDGRILGILRSRETNRFSGDIVAIDIDNYIDINQPTFANSLPGPAQTSLSLQTTFTDDTLSPGGRYASVYPLFDGSNRLLISWSPCNLTDGILIAACDSNFNANNEALLFGIWNFNPNDGTTIPIVPPVENFVYTDIVIVEPRIEPAVANDSVDLDLTLLAQSQGAIHIRSVYDLDGIDSATPDIATAANPGITDPATLPYKFLRIVKAVSIPDNDTLTVPGSAFGISTQQLMREIIGYVPIEPDGSVKAVIPANVPFAISLVDAQGMRVRGRHQNWLQVKPGEVLECRGCHTGGTSTAPHGRLDAQPPSVHSGAISPGVFPSTEPALFGSTGETMAEIYALRMGIRQPSVDVIYTDDWTDDSGALLKATAFSYLYSNMTTTAPTSDPCQIAWTNICRIVINYPDHIQPLWEVSRPVLDINGAEIANNRCTSCHSRTDDMANTQIPAGQLELTNTASDQVGAGIRVTSYEELFRTDNALTLDGTTLVDLQVPVLDGMGNPVFLTDGNGDLILDGMGNPIPVTETVTVNPTMSSAGAASSVFFDTFTNGGSHTGWLTNDELRLIAEWLDIGAQYYNNPFDIP